jgi:hypothetical protein
MSDQSQPTTFPVTVEEWAQARRASPERFLVAGFVMSVRRTAGLLDKKQPDAWESEYARYAKGAQSEPALTRGKKK